MSHSPPPQITLPLLRRYKAEGEKIACLTTYDATFTLLLEKAGIEILLVGDTLGMVIQGHPSTLPVTVDDMVYHARCVAKARQRALLMVDMPFMSYATAERAFTHAARLMQEGGAHIVKLEITHPSQQEMVFQLTSRGIPVCAHLGLTPQAVYKLGGYRVQGRSADTAAQMVAEARELTEAGADCLLLECVPAALAKEISQSVSVPVIGIGAGIHCDGQILVLQDVLGISPRIPKFATDFLQEGGSILAAFQRYVTSVKEQTFPAPIHSF